MPLYGLIDCAADPALYPMIQREPEKMCLFAGPIDPDLVSATPHIVRLDQGSAFQQALQGPGWTRNWGIVCASEARLWDVRRQLRKCLQVMLPNSRVVLFRFYDPRVWVPYIESCEGETLQPWFGAITDYWAPHAGGTVRYRAQGGALQRQQLMPAAAG